MKIPITNTHANQIDGIVSSTKRGQIIEFGRDIGLPVFGNTAAGAVAGGYIFENRDRLPGWWRVVNSGGHPVADDEAISRLKSEGHTLRNGKII